ncbi:hypothetical protein OHA37_30775 [Streptomyces sp. NBC_00335]|uniref:hypothetical protein n=1 Tax=unclassified Streptomyces TaxID=2593676 RepID=UPI002250657F|nr:MULTISPECIES: hypothetical protein [unclassified Streptomyces]MCX5408236.1 hypothetical protein [Streptomyces sp. NBC_00086]
MLTHLANGASFRPSFWLRVREFAVPPSMIETATARRSAGDWAGACAAAGVDVDFDLRVLARTHGRDLAARIRADLRHLAPDLLRWHLPRIAPDGLLRPGLTIGLARYGDAGPGPVHLVARTPPAWAEYGQRISLALWDGARSEDAARRPPGAGPHPHPHPHPRFRLDLHRHLWDARRSDELRSRSGADRHLGEAGPELDPGLPGPPPAVPRCAVDRWAAEAEIVLRAEGRPGGTVTVRLGARHRLYVHLRGDGDGDVQISAAAPVDPGAPAPPALPDAATWVLPDLELLRTGAIDAGRLHPLVGRALVPDWSPPRPAGAADPVRGPRLVDCRGARHRIGLVDGVLAPLDHDPAEIRREELLVALTGTPLPCLRAIDEAHRRPDSLSGVRERLDHGDTAGALAVVEGLLGPGALLRDGPLRDELEAAALRRVIHGLFRAGLAGPGAGPTHDGYRSPRKGRTERSHPRRANRR